MNRENLLRSYVDFDLLEKANYDETLEANNMTVVKVYPVDTDKLNDPMKEWKLSIEIHVSSLHIDPHATAPVIPFGIYEEVVDFLDTEFEGRSLVAKTSMFNAIMNRLHEYSKHLIHQKVGEQMSKHFGTKGMPGMPNIQTLTIDGSDTEAIEQLKELLDKLRELGSNPDTDLPDMN